jgi:hypothetical protein
MDSSVYRQAGRYPCIGQNSQRGHPYSQALDCYRTQDGRREAGCKEIRMFQPCHHARQFALIQPPKTPHISTSGSPKNIPHFSGMLGKFGCSFLKEISLPYLWLDSQVWITGALFMNSPTHLPWRTGMICRLICIPLSQY